MYPANMEENINQVVQSRSGRLDNVFPRLSGEDKTRLLEAHHPDYIAASMRELQVGVNAGDRAPQELVDLLEANSRVNPAEINLEAPDFDVDVAVIGGGGAGVSAALLAQEHGAKVLLTTKLRLGDGNTVGAQAGTQAADRPEDSPAVHYLDTIGGGHYCNIPELVKALVKDAPSAIQWLEQLGVNWDKEPDGLMHELSGGGASRRRLHSARDYTGLEEMRVLRDEMINRGIEYVEFSPAVELLTNASGGIAGVLLMNLETEQLIVVRAKAVILATGGLGRLHLQNFPTTNHYGATADGLVLAYRTGADLVFIDTMQYHPTGAAYPLQILGQLVTEKVRTLGAQLVNRDGEQFVNSLEARDIVASAIIRECSARGKGIMTPSGEQGVWLDSPMVDHIRGQGTIERELPAMVRQFSRYDIDITREPMLVYPTLHYQNGGIRIAPDGATNVRGLFAAGECSGGVHGRNRLIGNSTLELFVFGRRAGKAAAAYARGVDGVQPTLRHVSEWQTALAAKKLTESRPVAPILLPDYTGKSL
jgi:succinate dehydrogenase/fumarate reductase flavoprotein subunit